MTGLDKGTVETEWVKETTVTITVSQKTVQKFVRPSRDFVPFVAKAHFVKTRKGKDYTVVRLTIPKEAVVAMGLEQEDFLFLKGRIAEWFEMLNWGSMQATWQRLPAGIQERVLASGLGPSGPRSAGSIPAIGSVTEPQEGDLTALPAGTVSPG